MRSSFVSLAALALLAGSTMGDTIRMNQSSLSVGSGGEFTITPLNGFAGIVGLVADVGAGTFQTFCLERNEYFRSGSTFNFVMNTGAVQGGVAGQEPPGSQFDPINPMTAFLYFNFRMGTLTSYNYGAGRTTSANDLQQAIWFIEQEGGTNNHFVTLAQNAVSSGEWSGLGPVRALNLSNAEFPSGQDQLTLIQPIPTPGTAVLAGLGGLLATRRRR